MCSGRREPIFRLLEHRFDSERRATSESVANAQVSRNMGERSPPLRRSSRSWTTWMTSLRLLGDQPARAKPCVVMGVDHLAAGWPRLSFRKCEQRARGLALGCSVRGGGRCGGCGRRACWWSAASAAADSDRQGGEGSAKAGAPGVARLAACGGLQVAACGRAEPAGHLGLGGNPSGCRCSPGPRAARREQARRRGPGAHRVRQARWPQGREAPAPAARPASHRPDVLLQLHDRNGDDFGPAAAGQAYSGARSAGPEQAWDVTAVAQRRSSGW